MYKKLLDMFGISFEPLFGLDIGSSAVKVVQLSKKSDYLKVDHYAVEPILPGVVSEKIIKDRDAVVDAIKEAVNKAGIKSSSVCMAVPSSSAITRVIQLSADLNEREIGNEIEIEADRYIPYALDEVNLDYEVIGPSEKHDDLIDVLLAVSKNENIELITDIVVDAGLSPKIIDIDSYAVERAFPLVAAQLPEQGIDKIIALVDIGANITTLNIFKNNKNIYNREQTFGGQQLTNEIQNRYGLSFQEAMAARISNSLPDDYFPDVLEPFKEIVCQQVNRACQFFFSSGEYHELDYLLLTGGTSDLLGLVEMVQEKSNVKTFLANPFSRMQFEPNIDQRLLLDNASTLMNCCGLALRNCN